MMFTKNWIFVPPVHMHPHLTDPPPLVDVHMPGARNTHIICLPTASAWEEGRILDCSNLKCYLVLLIHRFHCNYYETG